MLAVKRMIDQVLGWMLIVLMGLSVINVLWQVFSRYVLNDPSTFTDELARYLLIWIGLLGAAYAVGKRMHLAIDLLPSKLTGRRRAYLGLFIEGCVFVFALAVMVWGGYSLMALMLLLGQTSAALSLPIGYVYFVVPLSGVLTMFYAGLHLYDDIRHLQGKARLLPATSNASPEAT